MKSKYFITILISSVLFAACEENPVYTDNLEQYRLVYMKQAAEYPNNQMLDITDSEQIVLFNACYGGYGANKKDIHITFGAMPDLVDAFNSANKTDYEVMAPESYQMDETKASILAGNQNSNSLKIKFHTAGYMTPGKSYLLPIGITQSDADVPVNENLKITYFLFSGIYPIGEEPPKQAFSLKDRGLVSLFTYKNFLTVLETNGLLNLYAYNTSANSFNSESSGINGGWNIFDMVLPSSTGFIARWAGSGMLWEYAVNAAGAISGDFQSKGEGFNVYDLMTSSIYHSALFCKKPTGEMYCVQREGTQWSMVTGMGTGWDQYVQILAYQDGILATDAKGDLWFIPVSEDKIPGEREHAGSGWDIYRQIVAFGNDLLALDNEGVLWQYKFDLRGFWEVATP